LIYDIISLTRKCDLKIDCLGIPQENAPWKGRLRVERQGELVCVRIAFARAKSESRIQRGRRLDDRLVSEEDSPAWLQNNSC
jgi:hypothetical protein